MGRIRMGYWDCPYCSTKKIPGSDRDCPNCGKPRSASTEFYLDDNEPVVYVNKETEQQVRLRGRDWVCEYCDSLNSGLDRTCKSCGAVQQIKRTDDDQNHEHSQSECNVIPIDRTNKSEQNKTYCNNSFHNNSSNNRNRTQTRNILENIIDSQWLKFTGIGLLAVAIITALILPLMPKDAEFTIQDISWEYNINIEKLTPVDESDWTMPAGAKLRYTQMETHHYEDVPDGYELVPTPEIDHYEEKVIGQRNLGNGYFEDITVNEPVYKTVMKKVQKYRKEPVKQLKYYYTIDKWLHVRNVTTSAHDKNPYWGEITLADKERENGRNEKYSISGYGTDDKQYICSVDYSFWTECEIGMPVKGKINILGHFTPDQNEQQNDPQS